MAPETELESDSVVPEIAQDSMDDVPSNLEESPDQTVPQEPDLVSTPQESTQFESPPQLATAFQMLADVVTERKSDPARLAAAFSPSLPIGDREDVLRAAIESVGVPKGVRSVWRRIKQQHQWCVGANDIAFTFDVNYDLLLQDLATLTNEILGDEIFDDLLNGILEDDEGPQVDVRQLVRAFEDDFVVVVHPSQRAPVHGTLMVIVPLKDAQTVQSAVGKMLRVDPNATTSVRRGFKVHVVDRNEEVELADLGFEESPADHVPNRFLPYAFCVVHDTLILGEQSMVYSALDRLNPSSSK